jgi:colanic acid biosynthesis glycosyl transferase WcaI
MKLIFFNRFFYPDTSATSQIVSDLAFQLAAEGFEIHAITSRVSDDEASREEIRGVKIHRVARALTGPHGLARRAMAYLEYYRGARKAARELIAPGDIVVLKTDPPMLSSAVGHLAKRRGARLVLWLQDVFPEVAVEYGVPGMSGPVGAVIRRVRNRSLAIADRVVVIGDRMASKVVDAGASPERIEVIHNWADGEAIKPLGHEENTLRGQWELGSDFVVGYSGNLGRVHEFETMLDAAALLADTPGIRFVVIGRGPRLQEVRARVERERIPNVRFEPHQDRDTLGQSLSIADVHLSVLQSRFEGLVHPSKLYGIMAVGRPTIFIGDAQGETAAILAATGSGLTVKSGDAAGLVAAIKLIRDQEETRLQMGQAARRAFDERYAMPIALRKWRSVLELLADGSRSRRSPIAHHRGAPIATHPLMRWVFAALLLVAVAASSYPYRSSVYMAALEAKRFALDRVPCPAQTNRTMVALTFGQSNAGNSGEYRHRARQNVINFYRGQCFVAQDPLLGSDGVHGSVWGLMGDDLSDRFDYVILIPAAVGSVTVQDWNRKLSTRFKERAAQPYRITHFLWHQGEANWHTDPAAYARELRELAATAGRLADAPFFVSVATICQNDRDTAIENAQRSVVDGKRILLGPDTDTLLPQDRKDGCHFSKLGQEKVARMWANAILRESP